MLFNVPFIPEKKYTRFLRDNITRLSSCHFSLHSSLFNDARHRLENPGQENILHGLAELKGVKKYALVNAAFHSPDLYFDRRSLSGAAAVLESYLDKNLLDGLVFTDHYYILALSEFAPGLCASLEAVPGVNLIIDDRDKARAWIRAVSRTSFKPPGKMTLDRSLNRRPGRLAELTRDLTREYPDMKIELLANEGCLHLCPFKPAHDAHIALSNQEGAEIRTGELNEKLGCRRVLTAEPELLFQSPFIRPEDLPAYEGKADVIKICGRTLGSSFLVKTVSAYLKGQYAGNLLELMDAMEWLSHRLYVDSGALPENFLEKLSLCERTCEDCSYCRNLFNKHVRPVEIRLPCL